MHTRIVLDYSGTIDTVVAFGTPVAFWYRERRLRPSNKLIIVIIIN